MPPGDLEGQDYGIFMIDRIIVVSSCARALWHERRQSILSIFADPVILTFF
jgi:hypothetical protein